MCEYFVHDGKNIKLEEIALKTLHYDYSNDHPLNSLVAGLDELCKKLKLKEMLGLFFQAVFAKQNSTWPHVEEEKQKKIVAFELSKNAFSIERINMGLSGC